MCPPDYFTVDYVINPWMAGNEGSMSLDLAKRQWEDLRDAIAEYAEVVTIDENVDGRINLRHLEKELQRFADRPLKIGSFSAASNVTGIGSRTRDVSALLHRYDALSFWDFAAAGPYVKIEMNPAVGPGGGSLAYKDALFISPHKFVGGPGTPGRHENENSPASVDFTFAPKMEKLSMNRNIDPVRPARAEARRENPSRRTNA